MDENALEKERLFAGPAPFMHRYYAASTSVPLDVVSDFDYRGRDRHYVLECETPDGPLRLLAKVFGRGVAADRDFRRLQQFAATSYTAVLHSGGFLFYEWIDGEVLAGGSSGRLSDENIRGLAAHELDVIANNGCGYITPARHVADVFERLRDLPQASRLAPTNIAAAEAYAMDFPVRLVRAPRNQGHWHYMLDTSGELRRTHVDFGEWSWRMDPAEDLASMIIELDLSVAQARLLVETVAARCEDGAWGARVHLGAISYLSRALNAYEYWNSQLARLPARYRVRRRPSSPETERRERLDHLLEQVVNGRDPRLATLGGG